MSVKRNKISNGHTFSEKQPPLLSHYCFTLNNYTDEEVFEIDTAVTNASSNIKYVCYGFEEGEDGTPHLQGYIELKKEGKLL